MNGYTPLNTRSPMCTTLACSEMDDRVAAGVSRTVMPGVDGFIADGYRPAFIERGVSVGIFILAAAHLCLPSLAGPGTLLCATMRSVCGRKVPLPPVWSPWWWVLKSTSTMRSVIWADCSGWVRGGCIHTADLPGNKLFQSAEAVASGSRGTGSRQPRPPRGSPSTRWYHPGR